MEDKVLKVGGYLRKDNEPIMSKHLKVLDLTTVEFVIPSTIGEFYSKMEDVIVDIVSKVLSKQELDKNEYISITYTYKNKIIEGSIVYPYICENITQTITSPQLRLDTLLLFIRLMDKEGVFIENLIQHIRQYGIERNELHPDWATREVVYELLHLPNVADFYVDFLDCFDNLYMVLDWCINNRNIDALGWVYNAHNERVFKAGYDETLILNKEVELHNKIKNMELSGDELKRFVNIVASYRHGYFTIPYLCHYDILNSQLINRYRLGLKVKDWVSAIVCSDLCRNEELYSIFVVRSGTLMEKSPINFAFLDIALLYSDSEISSISFERLYEDLTINGKVYPRNSRCIRIVQKDRPNQYDIMFDDYMWLRDVTNVSTAQYKLYELATNYIANV